ncbi:MAG TPA: glutathione transferase GstA [Pseudomonas sp.]|uniref:glutathione transferase GstA n=1 Tax=Pseudomonas sp. TaxID=306 RepID=UPI002B4A1869|nr:glutathione transferase GstA [Pseudomonas sp.]HKS15496.1 glutathione transferase GstA [Pseudomonas sp.]
MKLYYSPVTCALSPYIVMLESGLEHELAVVDLKTLTLPDGTDFRAINPLGYVPFLETAEGQPLAEGVAIIQYIADQAPEKHLAPANGTFERYQLHSRLNFIATELPKNYDYLFSSTASPETKDKAARALRKHYAFIENILSGQPYFNGEQFSVADAYLFTVTRWATLVDLDLSEFVTVQAYIARLAERPAVRAALEVELSSRVGATCGA